MVQEEWKTEVYLEPGEAWALNAGFLLTSVLDVLKNGETQIAIVDASAACHMPDVLEMPYLPPLLGTDETEEDGITVRLGGPTCLPGDVIGEYKFRQLPEYGDLLMFGDMAIYTTCKNNTLTECHCRISGSDVLTIRCSSLQILVIWILRKGWEVANSGFLFLCLEHVIGLNMLKWNMYVINRNTSISPYRA
mgnify:FL=1